MNDQAPVNKMRGWIRVAITVAILWTVVWSVIAMDGNSTVDAELASLKRFQETSQERGHIYWQIVSEHMARMNRGSAQVAAAVQWGIGVPLLLLILSPFGWWIYRGFIPRVKQEAS